MVIAEHMHVTAMASLGANRPQRHMFKDHCFSGIPLGYCGIQKLERQCFAKCAPWIGMRDI